MLKVARTPSSVSGPQVVDLYAQHKAKQEIDSLLDSDKPGAGAKAFAQGFAAAGGGAFLLGALPEAARGEARRQEAEALLDEVRLAKYIRETRGGSMESARVNAASVMKLLDMGVGGKDRVANNVLQEMGGVKLPNGQAVTIREYARDHAAGFDEAARAAGKDPSKAKIWQKFERFYSGHRTPEHTFQSFGTSAGGKEAVLAFLRKHYKPGMTSRRAELEILGKKLAPVALGAVPFAVGGGYEAYRAHRDRRRTLQQMRQAP
jgi:hypothetical protein